MKKFFALGLLVFAGTLALASADGTASGKLTINGKPYSLAYAYAWTSPNPFDESKKDVMVMLSDVKLTPKQAMDDFEPAKLAQDKKLNAVKLEIDPEGQVISGVFFTGARQSGQFTAAGMHKFEKRVLTSASIEGKLFMDKPDDFFDTTFVYSATFKAPIAAGKK